MRARLREDCVGLRGARGEEGLRGGEDGGRGLELLLVGGDGEAVWGKKSISYLQIEAKGWGRGGIRSGGEEQEGRRV